MDVPIGFGMSTREYLVQNDAQDSIYCQLLTNYRIYHKRKLADAIIRSNIDFDQLGQRLTKQDCEIVFSNNRKIVQSSGNSLKQWKIA